MDSPNFNYDLLVEKLYEKLNFHMKTTTLQASTDQYNDYQKRNRSERTYEGSHYMTKKLLEYFPATMAVDKIEIKEAEEFLEMLKKNAPIGVYNYLKILKAMWNKFKQWNYVVDNPFEHVKLKKKQQVDPKCVTEDMFTKVLKHISLELLRDILIVAFYTGLRLGELIKLTWQCVNLKDELLIVGNDSFETKSRKQRLVPIHPSVKKILLKRLTKVINNGKNYVFCKSNGLPFTGDYISRRFKRACRKAGLEEGIHFHCLRHGAATRMIANGAPLPAVQKVLGHSSIQTTMIYTHPDLESLREAVAKL